MTEQELKEKIVKILEEHKDWFIEEDYKRDIAKIDYNGIADALIENGIGDVSDIQAESNRYEMLYKLQGRDMVLAERKVQEYKNRAAVSEKALDKAVKLAYEIRTSIDTLSCSSCPMFDYGIFDECKKKGLYFNCEQRWKEELLKQAENELQEERKDD